jgi:hypothetical protein
MKTWAGKGGEREKRESDEEMECEMELRKHTNDKPTFSFSSLSQREARNSFVAFHNQLIR